MHQQCLNQPTLISLHPNEYTQGLCYYLFAVNLNRCVKTLDTLNELSTKVITGYDYRIIWLQD